MDDNAVLVGWLTRTGAGDRAAFRSLYDSTKGQLFGVVVRIVGQRDRAEEVLQETYIRVWHNAGRFDPDRGAPMAWLVTIARNCALSWRRANREDFSLEDTAPNTLEMAIGGAGITSPDAADRRALHHCLQELEGEQKDCILLAFIEGYTHDELARRMERPLGTVKSWIRRGLKRLKDCLTQ